MRKLRVLLSRRRDAELWEAIRLLAARVGGHWADQEKGVKIETTVKRTGNWKLINNFSNKYEWITLVKCCSSSTFAPGARHLTALQLLNTHHNIPWRLPSFGRINLMWLRSWKQSFMEQMSSYRTRTVHYNSMNDSMLLYWWKQAGRWVATKREMW